MTWRLAESLKRLREQLNEAYPKRSKVSDGAIGDAAHASRSSDHNPWIKDTKNQGVVTAIDITHDPKNGVDCIWLAKKLIESRDPRIKYIIWNARIISSKQQAWIWRKYNGANAHRHHLHISVMPTQSLYDKRNDWDLDIARIKEADNLLIKFDEPAVQVDKQTENPAEELAQTPAVSQTENQPPFADNSALQPDSSKTSSTADNGNIFDSFERYGDKLKNASQKITDVQSSFAPISNSSWFLTILTKIFGVILFVFGLAKDNWKEILIAALLIGLALMIYDRAKGRAVAKQIAKLKN